MERINYDDKVALYENPDIADINKVNASDMNNIKSTINGALDGSNPMGSIVVDDINCKNLLSDYTIINGWISGTTMRINSINGNRMAFIPCQSNTTYTISRSVLTGTFRVSDYTSVPNMTSSNVDYTIPTASENNNGTSITYTTSANAKYLIVHYGLIEDANLQASFDTIQVELGDTVTPYAKGKKIIKEENGYVKENTTFYANDFKCRNLFNPNSFLKDMGISSGGTISSNASTNLYYIPIEYGKSYIMSFADNNSSGNVVYGFSNDAPANNVSCTYNVATCPNLNGMVFTPTSASQKYLCIRLRYDATQLTNMSNIQLEVGSEATPYTEYKNFDSTAYVLWTNTNTGTAFNPQDVNISNLSDYRYYEIIYKLHATSLDYYQTSGKVPTGLNTCIGGGYARPNSTPRFWSRYVTYANTKLTFTTGYYSLNFTDNANTANDILVPYQILGYK